MTFRHGIALVLVGWYLMVPPSGSHQQLYIAPAPQADVPIAGWHISQRFDSVADCEGARKEFERHFHGTSRRAESDLNKEHFLLWATAPRCIADDPRLKEK